MTTVTFHVIEEILNCTDISSDQDVTQVLNEIRMKNLEGNNRAPK